MAKVKLLDVWSTIESWQRISAMRLSPKIALTLAAYQHEIGDVLEVCQKEKNAIIEHIAETTKDGVSIIGGMKELTSEADKAQLHQEFSKYLDGEVDVSVCQLTLTALAEDLEKRTENSAQSRDFVLLKPFFKAAE